MRLNNYEVNVACEKEMTAAKPIRVVIDLTDTQTGTSVQRSFYETPSKELIGRKVGQELETVVKDDVESFSMEINYIVDTALWSLVA